MINKASVEYKEARRIIDENFVNYDRFGCVSARNKIRRLLKENSRLREEYSWLEEELGFN